MARRQRQTTLAVRSQAEQDKADAEIKERQREIKYDLKDFTIELLVSKFGKGEFFVPDYQRQFVWRQTHKERFVESVILGLPIPFMFVAEMEDGRLEIVDGAQRIRTLEAFIAGDLKLKGLRKLPSLNTFRFQDLPHSQQRKFVNRTLRIVVLDESTSESLRQEIFDRINTTGKRAKAAEIRRGTYKGPFMDFVQECAKDPLFSKLCPVSEVARKHREPEELVVRFFVFSDRYLSFKHDVEAFFDDYVREMRDAFDRDTKKAEFTRMLRFVDKTFPHGFAKTKDAQSTPRVRFEAIAVGTNLALRQDPNLAPTDMTWLDSKDFEGHTTTHASNSLSRVKGRIEYVRDRLLESAAHG